MGNSPESNLPEPIRKTFEQFGVIKPAGWPKLDQLIKAITGRKYSYDLSTSPDGTATARVRAMGVTFTAIDGEPERALAKALNQALREHGKAQLDMFDDEPDTESSPDPFTERPMDDVGYVTDDTTYNSPTPDPSGPVRNNVRTADGQVVSFDERTGAMVDEDGVVLDLDPVETARIRSELQRVGARG